MKLSKAAHVNIKETWLDKLNLEEAEIPIITNIPKDEITTKTSVTFFQRMRRMAEILRDVSPRYRTTSDVIRAALYVGIPILFKLHEDDIQSQYARNFYEQIKRNTLFYEKIQVIDTVIIEVSRMLDFALTESISTPEVNKKIDDILASVPDDCRDMAKTKTAEVRKLKARGRDVTHLLSCRIYPDLYSRKGAGV